MAKMKSLLCILAVMLLLTACSSGKHRRNTIDSHTNEPFSQDNPCILETAMQSEDEIASTTKNEITAAEIYEQDEDATTIITDKSIVMVTSEATTVTTAITGNSTAKEIIASDVMTAAKTVSTGYTKLETLNHVAEKAIIEDYASLMGIDASRVFISGYYGNYDGGTVVLMNTYTGTTDETNSFALGENWLEISAAQMMYLYHDKTFIEIYIAYDDGLISDSDAAAISYYFKELGVTRPELPSNLPILEPLSEDVEKVLIDDYYKTIDPNYLDEIIGMGGAYVDKYYGTYNSGEVVLMKYYGMEETDTNSLLIIAGYELHFSTGYTNITLHYRGEFIPLSDAYFKNLLSREDIAKIAYYSRA